MKIIRKTVAKATPTPPSDRLRRLDALCARLNKDMDGLGYIGRGSNVKWLDPKRIRTGILGFDVMANGGLPRRSMTQLWGPYSVSKTTTLLAMIASAQRAGLNGLYAPSETFSKSWARDIGCWIPHSEDEYQALEDEFTALGQPDEYREVRSELERYDVGSPGLGQFLLVMHPHGDGLLEAVYQAVRSNTVDIAGVDSIAACKPSKIIEENEVGDDERGSGKQIQMLIQFTNKINSAFSLRYDADGVASPKDANKVVSFNETAVVCTNQAIQDQTPVMGPMRGMTGTRYLPSMGRKLHHAWNLSIEFKRGYLEDGQEEVSMDGTKRSQAAGIQVQARCEKSRVGPPSRTAQWHLYTRAFDGFKPGEVDAAREARLWGVHYGVIVNEGAWYTLPGERRLNGKDKVDAALRADPAMRQAIEEDVIERCRRQ